jgi:hypothetical protein
MAFSFGMGMCKPNSEGRTPFLLNLFGCGYAALGLFTVGIQTGHTRQHRSATHYSATITDWKGERKMASTSTVVNRSLRKSVVPVLRKAGFTKIDARNGWRWLDKAIWVFSIRAVGNNFSLRWPPGSLVVELGIFYVFMPPEFPIKKDKEGRLVPAEYYCHMRSNLERVNYQSQNVTQVSDSPERDRKDIWWVDPDGGDADAVADDIAISLQEQGLPWFSQQSNVATALAGLESERDCYIKFDKAALLAREIGDHERWHRYAALAEAEGLRIGRSDDWKARYGV